MAKKIIPKKNEIKVKKLSFREKTIAYVELMRLGNCIMASIAVLIGFFLAQGINYFTAFYAAFSALMICGAGQAINDYFDAKIDAKTSKQKPIPSGRVTKKQALWFSLILFFVGIIISFTINMTTTFIAIVLSILLIAYPLLMNKTKYLGNGIVALGTAITFVFGSAATGTIPLLVIILSISAFFSNLAREITKDIEDVRKDKGTKITLPMITKYAKQFVYAYYIVAIVLSLAAYVWFSLNYYYLAFALIGASIFIQAMLLLYNNSPMKSQKVSKAGMLTSLVAFVFAGFK